MGMLPGGFLTANRTYFVASGVGIGAPLWSRMTRSSTSSKGTNIEVTNNGMACSKLLLTSKLASKAMDRLTSVAQRMVQNVKIAKHLFASCFFTIETFKRVI